MYILHLLLIVEDARTDLAPLAFVLLVLGLVVLWRRKHSPPYLLCAAVFGVYLIFAVDLAFFPILYDPNNRVPITSEWFQASINLIPFKFDFSFAASVVVVQIFQNVLLTVPLGFGLNLFYRLSARRALVLALAAGMGTEMGQLVISLLTQPYRIIDVNDTLLNAAGVLIGWAAFKWLARLYLRMAERRAMKRAGLPGFLYAAASGQPAP